MQGPVKRLVDPALAQQPKALGLEAAGAMRHMALQRIVQASRTPLRDFRAALLGRLAAKVTSQWLASPEDLTDATDAFVFSIKLDTTPWPPNLNDGHSLQATAHFT